MSFSCRFNFCDLSTVSFFHYRTKPFAERHSIAIPSVLSVLFAGLTIIIAVTIIYLTSPSPTSISLNSDEQCELNFQLLIPKPIEYQFNNDTFLDLVIAQKTANKIPINDHQLLIDIVVTNFDINSISISYGIGNGSFANLTDYSTDSSLVHHSINVIDINNDSRLDIVITNFDSLRCN